MSCLLWIRVTVNTNQKPMPETLSERFQLTLTPSQRKEIEAAKDATRPGYVPLTTFVREILMREVDSILSEASAKSRANGTEA